MEKENACFVDFEGWMEILNSNFLFFFLAASIRFVNICLTVFLFRGNFLGGVGSYV